MKTERQSLSDAVQVIDTDELFAKQEDSVTALEYGYIGLRQLCRHLKEENEMLTSKIELLEQRLKAAGLL